MLGVDAPEMENEEGMIFIPFAFYSPETSVGLGASMLRYRKTDQELDIQNNVLGNAIVTLNKQFSIVFQYDGYRYRDIIKLDAEIESQLFPESYWGIGPDADHETEFTPLYGYIGGSVKHKIIDDMYFGPVIRFYTSEIIETGIEDGEEDIFMGLPGNKTAQVAGGGFRLICDTRDDTFAPSHGVFLDYQIESFYEFRDEYSNVRNEVDLRFYQQIIEGQVLALQLFGSFSDGTVPFQSLSRLGGSKLLRGYYEGRYRDRCYAASQLEWRGRIYKRFGMVAFGALGAVAPAVDDFQSNNLKYGYGLGFRYQLSSDQKINLRLDFGFGDDGMKFYFQALEAF